MEEDIVKISLQLSVVQGTIRTMIIELNREYRDHNFLPDDISHIPVLYETEEVEADDKIIHLHFHIPHSMQAFDWWIAELRPEENLAFGYACLNGDAQNAEWGYINLEELENILASRPEPVVVVREVDFVPKPWHEVLEGWKRRR